MLSLLFSSVFSPFPFLYFQHRINSAPAALHSVIPFLPPDGLPPTATSASPSTSASPLRTCHLCPLLPASCLPASPPRRAPLSPKSPPSPRDSPHRLISPVSPPTQKQPRLLAGLLLCIIQETINQLRMVSSVSGSNRWILLESRATVTLSPRRALEVGATRAIMFWPL